MALYVDDMAMVSVPTVIVTRELLDQRFIHGEGVLRLS